MPSFIVPNKDIGKDQASDFDEFVKGMPDVATQGNLVHFDNYVAGLPPPGSTPEMNYPTPVPVPQPSPGVPEQPSSPAPLPAQAGEMQALHQEGATPGGVLNAGLGLLQAPGALMRNSLAQMAAAPQNIVNMGKGLLTGQPVENASPAPYDLSKATTDIQGANKAAEEPYQQATSGLPGPAKFAADALTDPVTYTMGPVEAAGMTAGSYALGAGGGEAGKLVGGAIGGDEGAKTGEVVGNVAGNLVGGALGMHMASSILKSVPRIGPFVSQMEQNGTALTSNVGKSVHDLLDQMAQAGDRALAQQQSGILGIKAGGAIDEGGRAVATGGKEVGEESQYMEGLEPYIKRPSLDVVPADVRQKNLVQAYDDLANAKRVSGSIGGQSVERSLGMPRDVDTPEQLSQLYDQLYAYAQEGEPGRYWYENSSKQILDMFGGDKDKAEKFVQLLAIYSPQNSVSANTTNALRAWSQYQSGLPIKAGKFDWNDRVATDLLYNDNPWVGRKTNNFYNNLMIFIDPSKSDPASVTTDRWIMRAFNYKREQPSPAQYDFTEKTIRNITDDLNQNLQGGEPWTPYQTQAAIWTSIKTRVEMADVMKEWADKNSHYADVLGLRSEMQTAGVPGEHFDAKGKPMDMDPETGGPIQAMKRTGDSAKPVIDAAGNPVYQDAKPLNTPPKSNVAMERTPEDWINRSGKSFKDYIDQNKLQVSAETAPGASSGKFPEYGTAPEELRQQYDDDAGSATLLPNGQNILTKVLGIPSTGTIRGPGYFKGEASPGWQIEVPTPNMQAKVGGEGSQADYDLIHPDAKVSIDGMAALWGKVYKQDAMATSRPVVAKTPGQADTAGINLGRTPSSDEMVALGDALKSRYDINDLGLVFTRDGVWVRNFGADENQAFQASIHEIADGLWPKEDVKIGQFKSDGSYIEAKDYDKTIQEAIDKPTSAWNDVKYGPNFNIEERYGAGYREQAADRGRSVLQGKFRDLEDYLTARLAKVDGEYAQRYGWTPDAGLSERLAKADSVLSDPGLRARLGLDGAESHSRIIRTLAEEHGLDDPLAAGIKSGLSWKMPNIPQALGTAGGAYAGYNYNPDPDNPPSTVQRVGTAILGAGLGRAAVDRFPQTVQALKGLAKNDESLGIVAKKRAELSMPAEQAGSALSKMAGTAEQANQLRPDEPGHIGNLSFDKFKDPDTRQIIQEAFDETNQFAGVRGGVKPDAVLMDNAAKLAGYRTTEDWTTNMRKKGFTDEENVALASTVDFQAQKLTELNAKAEALQHAVDVAGPNATKQMQEEAEVAKYQAATKALETHAVVGAFSKASAESGRALRALRTDVLKNTGSNTAILNKAYKALGTNPEGFNSWIGEWLKTDPEDSVKRFQLLNMLGAPNWTGRIVAYQTNNMLSATTTSFVVGVHGGTMLMTHPFLRAVRYWDPKGAAAETMGTLKATGSALANAITAFKTGVGPETAEHAMTEGMMPNRAFMGNTGLLLTPASRGLEAIHEFYRTMAGAQAAAGWAYSVARKTGRSVDDVRMNDLGTPEAQKYIAEQVDKALTGGPMTPVGQIIMKGKNLINSANPDPARRMADKAVGFGFNQLFPFVRIPDFLFRNGLKMTPGLNLGWYGGNFAKHALEGNFKEARGDATMLAVSMGIDGYLYQLAASGNMSGDGPSNPTQKAALAETGWQPHSVKIGDHWIDYSSWGGPLAVPMAAISNLVERFHENDLASPDKKKDLPGVMGDVGTSTLKVLADASYLRFFGTLVKSIEDGRADPAIIGNLLSRNVPEDALLAQAARATDPNTKVTEGGPLSPTGLAQSVESRIPGLSQNVPNKVSGTTGQPLEQPFDAVNMLAKSVAERTDNPTAMEVNRLHNAGFNVPIREFPTSQQSNGIIYAGIHQTPETSRKIAKAYGEAANRYAGAMIASPAYQSATDAQRAEALTKTLRLAYRDADVSLSDNVGRDAKHNAVLAYDQVPHYEGVKGSPDSIRRQNLQIEQARSALAAYTKQYGDRGTGLLQKNNPQAYNLAQRPTMEADYLRQKKAQIDRAYNGALTQAEGEGLLAVDHSLVPEE